PPRALTSFPTRRSSDLGSKKQRGLMARNLGQCAAASIALALAAVTCSAHADVKPEYNGMRLHELYVENLTPDHRPLDATSPLHRSEEHTSELQSRSDLV